MAEHDVVHPAHQFDSIEQQKEAVTLGMWAFLVTEIMFFGGLFIAYALYRLNHAVEFSQACRQLHLLFGSVNTMILIGSSLTMALAVESAKTGRKAALNFFLLATVILGSAFLTVKGVEYAHKFHEHLVPGPNFQWEGVPTRGPVQLFFSFYFAMTGLHAFHMVVGIVILLILVGMSASGKISRNYYAPIEISGLYWHFVEIVWIFIFPLLYLIGRHA